MMENVAALPVQNENEIPQLQNRGRVYERVRAVGDGLKMINDATAKIVVNAVALQNFARCFAYAIAAGELIKGCTAEACGRIKDSLHGFSAFVDTTRVFDNVNYFLSGEWQKHDLEGRHYQIAGKGLLLVGGIAGATGWLAEAGAVNLGKLAHSIGRIRIFSFVSDVVKLGKFSMSVAGVGLTFLAADAVTRLVEGRNPIQSWCDLAWCVSEVALVIFLLVGCTCPITHVVLGLAAASTGIISHLYGEYRPEPPKERSAVA